MHTAVKTVTSYQFEITVPEMLRLLERDKKNVITNDLLDLLTKKTNATGIDYDGHFGANVYYDLNVQDDTPKEHAKIAKIILKYVKE